MMRQFFRLSPLLLALFVWAAGPVWAADEDPALSAATAEDGLYAVFETSMGDIVCVLAPDKVPVTVGNFVGLAEGSREFTDPDTGKKAQRPFYDGLIFHRVINDFMVQGGCPLGQGTSGPGYTFMDEFDPSLRHDGPGVLSMANSGPATNGSQFFITHKATPWLDDKHSVFGHVVLGQDIVNAMGKVSADAGNRPLEPVTLDKLRIVRSGKAAKDFDAEAAFDERLEIEARREAEKKEAAERFLAELSQQRGNATTLEGGLQYILLEEGSGPVVQKGQVVRAHYTGYLEDGSVFDSTRGRGRPFQMNVGSAETMVKWDEAILLMKEGEEARIIVPPTLAFGDQGVRDLIPPGSTLIFDVEILEIVP